MADNPAPVDYTALVPKAGDTHHAEREKAELSRRIARDFLDVGDGQGLSAMLSVMLSIATDTAKVRPRTRANTAKAYVELALRAASSGVKVAIQNNNGPAIVGPPREFYQATLADPAGRALALAELSRALGVPAPVPLDLSATAAPAPTPKAAPAKRKVRRVAS